MVIIQIKLIKFWLFSSIFFPRCPWISFSFTSFNWPKFGKRVGSGEGGGEATFEKTIFLAFFCLGCFVCFVTIFFNLLFRKSCNQSSSLVAQKTWRVGCKWYLFFSQLRAPGRLAKNALHETLSLSFFPVALLRMSNIVVWRIMDNGMW